MIQDEVLFTPQLATVVVDLHRRIAETIALRATAGWPFSRSVKAGLMRSSEGTTA